jgi:hypothetical protein
MDFCPYCNAKVEICHDDGYGYDECGTYQEECPSCEKIFIYTTRIKISHDCEIADCLNDGEHTWYPTMTVPKFFTEMECSQCHERRKPTDTERIKYEIPEKYENSC